MYSGPRPTDEEFDALKKRRDDAVREMIAAVCRDEGWDPATVQVHCSHAGDCYCACPDGPCQHIWDGPDYIAGGMVSVTCSRCGTPAIYHDIRVLP